MCVRIVALATTLALGLAALPTASHAAPERPAAAAKRPAPTKKVKTAGKKAEVMEPALVAPTAGNDVPVKSDPAVPTQTPPTLSTKYRAVAVLPVDAADVGEDMVRAVEQALITEIDEKSGFRAVSPRDVTTEAASYNLDPSHCGNEDVACWSQAARYARAHLAVVTRVAAFGGVINVSMRLLDAQTSSELGRVAQPLSDKADERAAQIHRLTVQLFTPADYVGTLIVKSDESSADIYLNDKLVGTTPLKAPLKNLAAGPYILHVSKEGFGDVYQFVDVAYNRVSTITVSLATNTISGNIAFESDTGFGQVYVISDRPGVEIRLDGEPKGLTPLEGAIMQVAAGTRRLSLRRGKASPLMREVQVENGKRTDVGVTVNADGTMTAVVIISPLDSPLPMDPALSSPLTGVATTAPEPQRSHPIFTSGLVVAGLGVVALGVGGVFASQVRSANDDAEAYAKIIKQSEDPVARNEAREKLAQLNEDGPGKEHKQWIALGVGGGLLLTGGLLMAADHWHWFGIGKMSAARDSDHGWRVGVFPSSGGGIVSLGAPW